MLNIVYYSTRFITALNRHTQFVKPTRIACKVTKKVHKKFYFCTNQPFCTIYWHIFKFILSNLRKNVLFCIRFAGVYIVP